MTNEEANAWIEKWWAETPEAKLELIDGRLIISTLAGSRRILWTLLRDYGPPKALPWAPRELWWEALAQAFDPQPRPRTPEEWTAWAAGLDHDPEPAPAGPFGTIEHRHVFDLLQSGLSSFCGVRGKSLGRDFVIRLGENAFTPDLIFIDHARLANQHELSAVPVGGKTVAAEQGDEEAPGPLVGQGELVLDRGVFLFGVAEARQDAFPGPLRGDALSLGAGPGEQRLDAP